MRCLLDSISGKISTHVEELSSKGFKIAKTEFGDYYIEIDSLNEIINMIEIVRHDVIVRHPDWYGISEYIPYLEIMDKV